MNFSTLLKKYLATGLVLVFLLQPTLAFAQAGLLGPVPTVLPGETGGIAGSIATVAFRTAMAAAVAANEGCARTEETFFTVNKVVDIAYGGLSLIGGSAAETANLERLKNEIDGFIICRNRARDALLAAVPTNIYDGQSKQRLADEVNLAIQTLNKRKEDIAAQAKIAKRGLWKGILAGILIKTTKVVAERLVYSLTSRFKINDIMQYADAVASQVYTAQLIHDRAGDNEEQMIFRSILSNPLLRSKIDSAIYQRAADALQLNGDVFSARTMSADDPDFYLKLAQFGAPEASPQFLRTTYENRAAEIRSVGLASAQNEVLLGSGLKAPRTCAGNVNEQKSIEERWGQANDRLADRLSLYRDLQNAYDTRLRDLSARERTQLADDLDKAEDDYLQAAATLKALPRSFNSAGREKSLLFKTCEAIASPAESVNKGIDAAFKSFSKGLGDYNENNMPFFMNWVSEIGSNIASNLIFGGDLKTTLLAESGNLATAVNLGLNFADVSADRANLENGISFSSSRGSGANQYVLSWEILDVKNASFVTIAGEGTDELQRDPRTGAVITDPATRLPVLNRLHLTGSRTITARFGGGYLLKVYDSAGKVLNSGRINISPSANSPAPAAGGGNPQNLVCGGNYASYQACFNEVGDATYCASICGQVSGANIKSSVETPRGSIVEKLR